MDETREIAIMRTKENANIKANIISEYQLTVGNVGRNKSDLKIIQLLQLEGSTCT